MSAEGPASYEVVAPPVPSYMRPLPLKTQIIRLIPVFFIVVLILSTALNFANDRMPDPKMVPPLPDVGIEWTPKILWLESGTDILIFFLVAPMAVLWFKLYLMDREARGCARLQLSFLGKWLNMLFFSTCDSGLRPFPIRDCYLIACIRFLSTYSVVLLFRAVVIVMTAFPATDNACQTPLVIDNPFKNIVLTVLTLGSAATHCGDLMFSGHTVIICLAAVELWTYSPFIHSWILRVWASVLAPASFFCIISSRSHYSDDIIVSIYITIATYLLHSHSYDGAPWQMQLIFRWWPCCGKGVQDSLDETRSVGGTTGVVILQEAFAESQGSGTKMSTEGVTPIPSDPGSVAVSMKLPTANETKIQLTTPCRE